MAVFMFVGGLVGLANHYVAQGLIAMGVSVVAIGWALYVARRSGGFHGDGFDFASSEVAVADDGDGVEDDPYASQ